MTKLRVGVSPYAYLNLSCYPSEETGCPAGSELDILHTLGKLGGFEFELIATNITGCGGMDKGGKWFGLLEMLMDGRIDLTGNLCGVNKLNQKFGHVLTASWPVWQYQEQFVIQALTTPPLSFAPFAPLSTAVWIAYAVTFLALIIFGTLYSRIHEKSSRSVPSLSFRTFLNLSDSTCGFVKQLPAQAPWALWLLMLLSFTLFFQTFVLSAVLHTFPVWRPFSSGDQLTKALMSGEYRLLSYKDPPAVPDVCLGRPCEQTFSSAIAKRGYEYASNASGLQIMSMIAEQPPDAGSKLVLALGRPFVSMYMNEYVKHRDRIWLIDNGFENWSSYVWKKNFTHERRFNKLIKNIGDYKDDALRRATGETFGSRPYTGEKISGTITQQGEALGVGRLTSLFLMYFIGIGAGCWVLLLEIVSYRVTGRLLYQV